MWEPDVIPESYQSQKDLTRETRKRRRQIEREQFWLWIKSTWFKV